MPVLSRPLGFVAALVLLSACTADAPAPAEATGPPADTLAVDSAAVADPDPATLDLSRIVTIGGPVTETVYALGLGERVAGTDRSSVYPKAIQAKPRLDYFRQTSAEGVLSLKPTLVLAVDGTGPPGVVEQIRSAGVPVVVLNPTTTVDAAETRIARLGRLLGRTAQADSLVARMRADLAGVERPATAPRVLFVYTRGARTVLASGTGNEADAVLRLAGAENAITSYEGYKPLTAEAVVAAQPDVIVVPRVGLESLGGLDALLAQPGIAQTPAGKARRVVVVDDSLLLGFGPRLGEGVRTLAAELRAAVASATS